MSHPIPASRLVSPAVHCQHLRHKGMYVLSTPDPDEERFCGRYDATACWCTCTQTGVGPDGNAVNAAQCVSGGGRGCCS